MLMQANNVNEEKKFYKAYDTSKNRGYTKEDMMDGSRKDGSKKVQHI